MKYNKDIVEFFGNLVCASFLDIFLEHKQPQIVFELKVEGVKQQVRVVMLDNRQHVLTKEQIQEKIEALQQRKTDVGFSYTIGGLRVIVVPEQMTMLSGGGIVPFGTGAG